MYAYGDLIWTGDELRLGRRTVAAIEPDREWPGMWRARSGEHLSDMTNRTLREGRCGVSRPCRFKHPREARRGTQDLLFREARYIGSREHLTRILSYI